jgi:YrbI family 3-deoxy-D-manno-octulosonate 8-phosphate phosphatase
MKVVTIIPARGGSKGVPLKNIREIAGIPLISRAIRASLACRLVSRTYVATDSVAIADIAANDGADIIWRTDEISTDTASSESVLEYSIDQLSDKPDIVVFLQCTSPFIRSEYISEVVSSLVQSEADSALAVVGNHHFLWKESDDGYAVGVNHDGKKRLRRQDLPPEYLETGAIYAFRTDSFLRERTRFCGKTLLIKFDDELLGFEIDSFTDLRIAEALAQEPSNSLGDLKPNQVKMIVFDFDGVFTDNQVYVSEDGKEYVRCSRADGLGIELLKRTRPDIRLLVLSKEANPVVMARCQKLKIECLHAVEDKLTRLLDICSSLKIDISDVAYIGNDINDLPCLKSVGLPVCPNDAYPEIKKVAKIILNKNGGFGAVREICDWLRENK